MDNDDEDGGLFNIEFSSSDESTKTVKVPRDFQSEEDFQTVRREWKPKIEVGEVSYYLLSSTTTRSEIIYKIWKTLRLPMDNPSKPEAQAILHAIEELFFCQRYEEARDVAVETLKGELIDEFRKTVDDYKRRCEAKISLKA